MPLVHCRALIMEAGLSSLAKIDFMVTCNTSFNIFEIVLIVKIFLASGRLIGGFSAFKI